jgi:glycerol-1-phosphate dehydrogenase [NAD(P)+]
MTGAPARKIAIPRLLHVCSGCLGDVARLLEDHGFDVGRVLVGSGPGPSRLLAERVVAAFHARGIDVIHRSHLTGRLDQAAATAATIIEEGVTVAVGVGGGRVIDTIKVAAARTRIEFVSVPTTISNDGISSPVASLVGKDGARCSHPARMPSGIVVDVEASRSAPSPTSRAGVGDLVSNLTACLDWRLADRLGRERYDAYAAMIAESAARPVLELDAVASAAGHELIAQGLVLSGLAMAAAGTSRPCSGAEHLVSHALDAALGSGASLHGQQVAIGCLISAAAHESPLLPVLQRTFERLGLPTCGEQIEISRADVVDAVIAAPSLRPDRWTVLSDERFRDRGVAERLVHEAFGGAALPALAPGRQLVASSSRRSTRSVARPSSRWQKRARNVA